MKGKSSGGHFDLGPATRAEIAQMIRMPALAAGLHFGIDPETKAQLDDILCEATAANPDALPLLQYTLQELYLQRSSITTSVSKEFGNGGNITISPRFLILDRSMIQANAQRGAKRHARGGKRRSGGRPGIEYRSWPLS